MLSCTARVTERELPLANSMRELYASECDLCGVEGLQTMHRGAPPLDRPVILLD